MSDIKVKIIGLTENPQLLSTAGALGCFEEKSSIQLMEELTALPGEQRLKKERGCLKNSFGRGHGSVGDQNCFIFSIENLPRLATLQLCLPEYLAHLQQSLRRATASRGFYISEAIANSVFADEVKQVMVHSFELYDKMCEAKIPAEDARFLLPLATKTNIQTAGNARELCHLYAMSHDKNVPKIVTDVVDEMVRQAKEIAPDLFEDFGFNYERLSWYPSSQLFSGPNRTLNNLIDKYGDSHKVVFLKHMSPFEVTEEMLTEAVTKRNEAELANLKHVHFEFLVPMSLACFHQATRQRTWDHSIESIYDTVDSLPVDIDHRGVTPPSIRNSDFVNEYEFQHQCMVDLFEKLVCEGISKPEAIGVIPHSVKIHDLIHVNGWNALHSIGKRTCQEAQWEIRLIALQIAKYIKEVAPAFEKFAEPQCVTYGKCPEIKSCGRIEKLKK